MDHEEFTMPHVDTGDVEIVGGASSGWLDAIMATVSHNLEKRCNALVDVSGLWENSLKQHILMGMKGLSILRDVDWDVNGTCCTLGRAGFDETLRVLIVEDGNQTNGVVKKDGCWHYVFLKTYGANVRRSEAENKKRWWMRSHMDATTRSLSAGVVLTNINQTISNMRFQTFREWVEIEKMNIDAEVEKRQIKKEQQALRGLLENSIERSDASKGPVVL
jgi:hypothetical protein